MFQRQWRKLLFLSGLHSECGEHSATQEFCGLVVQSRHDTKGWVTEVCTSDDITELLLYQWKGTVIKWSGNHKKHLIPHKTSVASFKILPVKRMTPFPAVLVSLLAFSPILIMMWIIIISNLYKDRGHITHSWYQLYFPYWYVSVQGGRFKSISSHFSMPLLTQWSSEVTTGPFGNFSSKDLKWCSLE